MLGDFSKRERLTNLYYPQQHVLEQLVEVFVDRVDPIIKILHVPTFVSTLKNAHGHPHEVTPSVEAVVLAFYLLTVALLKDDECFSMLGEQKQVLVMRYKAAARQGLVNANFLKSSNLMTLQAFVMFIIGMRDQYQNDSLFILSGIAIRLARRMGLHRDGTMLGLSPFQTEMRRRIWWHIVHMDCRTSYFSSTKPSTDLFLGDAKFPLNVDDEDLSPEMTQLPSERTGLTSIVLCVIRCHIADFSMKILPCGIDNAHATNIEGSSLTLAEKDAAINQIEDALETKFLRYYDPSNAFHTFAMIAARSSICIIRLSTHNPRQFASGDTKATQESRDIFYINGIKLLEYSNLMHGDQQLHKYKGQISTNYFWGPLSYVLIETRHRKFGNEVNRAWELIGTVFVNHPQILERTAEPLCVALRSWTLQVWDECVSARKEVGLPEVATPGYIVEIRESRRPVVETAPKASGLPKLGNAEHLAGNNDSQGLGYDEQMLDLAPMDMYDFSNLPSFDLDPNEWVHWDRLLAAQDI